MVIVERSSFDRFSSREDDLSFLTTEYAEGMLARGQGKLLKDNLYPLQVSPSSKQRSKWALWNAGWADQDMIQLQEVR